MKKIDLVKKLFLVLIASFVPIFPQADFLEALPVIPSNHNSKIVKVTIEGNTVLSYAELEAVIAGFRDKPTTLENIQQIAKAIAKYYVAKGYTTSDAYPILNQNISEGEVRILVLEGILETIEIYGLHSVRENYLRDRLTGVGKVLNTARLLEQLQILQLNPLFASVKAELKPGSQPQSTTLSLEIVENPNFDLSFAIDNYGAFNSGEIEGDTNLTINSLTGNGDRETAGFA